MVLLMLIANFRPHMTALTIELPTSAKGVPLSEGMQSLGKIVCRLPDKRLNLYHEENLIYKSEFFRAVADDCMMPIVVYG